jgi:hypothetical protein
MPVVLKHVSSRRALNLEDLEMCVWPGSAWQRQQQLPRPIQQDVYIQNKPQMIVYVR